MKFSTAMAVWAAAAVVDAVGSAVALPVVIGRRLADALVSQPVTSVIDLAVIGLVMAVVLTLPAFLVLERLRWLKWWTAVLSVLVVGGALMLVTDALVSLGSLTVTVLQSGWVPVVGSLAGWAVWRRMEPRVMPVAGRG